MAYLNSRPRTPEVCPVCGENVPPRSLACPECGADHNTGWKKDACTYDGLDLPDDDFNYKDFKEKEFGRGSGPKAVGIKPIWWVTAIVLLAVYLVLKMFAVLR